MVLNVHSIIAVKATLFQLVLIVKATQGPCIKLRNALRGFHNTTPNCKTKGVLPLARTEVLLNVYENTLPGK